MGLQRQEGLDTYGVLKGQVVDTRPIQHHYQIHVRTGEGDYRVAINMESLQSPHELRFHLDPNFSHEIPDGRLVCLQGSRRFVVLLGA